LFGELLDGVAGHKLPKYLDAGPPLTAGSRLPSGF
jgi:hypothetical protein